ncbi:MAG TPA: hypothetical protein VMR37_08285 [Rhabdochlamydiaceae bacterium]|nr:hypothetical protein [Rhabdochlamydiaceae bacterium]
MNNWQWFLSMFLVSASALVADTSNKEAQCNIHKPQGWSFDIGGDYTWMSFSTPPTYSGSTGGVLGKITYEQPKAFFGQARSIYNLGPLSSSLNKTGFHEWYSEFVGGYCFSPTKNWMITPYAGLGLDFLSDHHRGYSFTPPIHLNYKIYYAVAGLKTHYTWRNWMLGLQVDCLPTFNQYIRIKGLPEAAWILKNRTGVAVQLPVAFRYVMNFWLEFAPYYRFLPIGASDVLGLSHRNLNQWGAFVTFRFFL